MNLGRHGPVGPDKSDQISISSPSSFPNGQPIDLAMDLAMAAMELPKDLLGEPFFFAAGGALDIEYTFIMNILCMIDP